MTVTGHIQRRGPNTYRIMIFLGRDPGGRQRFATRTVHGTWDDADRARAEMLPLVRAPRRQLPPLHGHIQRRRPGVWRVHVWLRKTDGVQRSVTRTIHGTRADANKVLGELLAAHHPGRGVCPAKVARRRAAGSARKVPLAPLIEAAGGRGPLARIVRASGSTMKRAAADGITLDRADRWAVALGRHPSEVWPEWSMEEQLA
jgi:hypothetical protein